jgi:hypothetical protein
MKVFSLEKFKKDVESWEKNLCWAKECDGQPVKDGMCEGKNGVMFHILDEWCEDVTAKGETELTKLNQIKAIVGRVLEAHEEARKDDFVLFALVCDEMGVPSNFDFRTMLREHKLFGLPSWESVSRARRKIQAEYRELTDAKTVEKRAEEIPVYKEFARQ